jgi:hypothetical protein
MAKSRVALPVTIKKINPFMTLHKAKIFVSSDVDIWSETQVKVCIRIGNIITRRECTSVTDAIIYAMSHTNAVSAGTMMRLEALRQKRNKVGKRKKWPKHFVERREVKAREQLKRLNARIKRLLTQRRRLNCTVKYYEKKKGKITT